MTNALDACSPNAPAQCEAEARQLEEDARRREEERAETEAEAGRVAVERRQSFSRREREAREEVARRVRQVSRGDCSRSRPPWNVAISFPPAYHGH